MLATEGIPDLALTTNGQRLAQMAEELKGAGLRRVNVSLDTLRPDRFRALARGGELSRTLNGIEAALRAGLTPVKINTVVMRGYNDDELADLVRFALNRGCQVRFLELMPIGCARAEFHRRFVSSFEVRARLAESFDLRPLPYEVGQTSRSFVASDSCDRRGLVGFISPCTQSFCLGCTRIRLTCTGRLVGCLAQGTGRSLGPLLRSDSPQAVRIVNRIVMEALEGKAQRSGFENAMPMAYVGG
jgi:cyclic pyranopterin phosphate synthase